jgi:RimJ/RimL family protein N-acetyltransferase
VFETQLRATPSLEWVVVLRLVPFAPEHFATVASWFNDERDAVQWAGPTVHYPLDAAQLQAMVDLSQAQPPARLCYMAERSGDLVGHAQLGLDWRNGNARLGRVAVSPSERGQGLAVPMLGLILAKAFSMPEIERVDLGVFTSNTPAIRTYQRLGFTLEGVRRSSVRVDGERWDSAEMSILRPEWQQTTQASA